jgi:hypothetical protein
MLKNPMIFFRRYFKKRLCGLMATINALRRVLSPLFLSTGVTNICIILQFTADSFLKGEELSQAGRLIHLIAVVPDPVWHSLIRCVACNWPVPHARHQLTTADHRGTEVKHGHGSECPLSPCPLHKSSRHFNLLSVRLYRTVARKCLKVTWVTAVLCVKLFFWSLSFFHIIIVYSVKVFHLFRSLG